MGGSSFIKSWWIETIMKGMALRGEKLMPPSPPWENESVSHIGDVIFLFDRILFLLLLLLWTSKRKNIPPLDIINTHKGACLSLYKISYFSLGSLVARCRISTQKFLFILTLFADEWDPPKFCSCLKINFRVILLPALFIRALVE